MRANVRVYKMNSSFRSRLTHGKYYAVQSIVDDSMTYVISDDEVAVMTSSVVIRLPKELFGEIAEIASDMKDLKERGIL